MIESPLSDFATQHKLTPREREVLNFVAVHGYTNEQLSVVLDIQYKTAVNHMANLLTKTHCGTTRELLAKVITTLLPEKEEN